MNYHILKDSIVLNFDGRTEVIARSDERYQGVINAIKEGDLESIPDILNGLIKDLVDAGLSVIDGIVHVNGKPFPNELSNKILIFAKEKLPFSPLVKFWENLKKNPSFNSRQMLYKFLEHNGHPITPDGCFIAYRGVTDDFRDCHTKMFDNSIGSVCSVDRSEVDDNPNNTCSFGLHVACFEYANGFGSKTIEVKVNPADVVAVPTDYNGTKMRVCRFEVVALSTAERTDILATEYFDDDYFEEYDDTEEDM